jgi:hypothetical protein
MAMRALHEARRGAVAGGTAREARRDEGARHDRRAPSGMIISDIFSPLPISLVAACFTIPVCGGGGATIANEGATATTEGSVPCKVQLLGVPHPTSSRMCESGSLAPT